MGRLVTMVLSDEDLKELDEELEAVRTSMLSLRTQLATELENCLGQIVWFLADHRGMFSRLGALEQVNELRENMQFIWLEIVV